jgi:transcriptional regulator with XRE-family HTH domain
MPTASERLVARVRRCMDDRRMSQTGLAALMGKTQSWLSRRLSGNQSFRMKDLDRLATIFEVTVPELFFDDYGQWDRRSKSDRRKGERRKSQHTIYDAKIEIIPSVARAAFPPKEDHNNHD